LRYAGHDPSAIMAGVFASEALFGALSGGALSAGRALRRHGRLE
jgi:hypothetical protein